MTDHPITPPPELVNQWVALWQDRKTAIPYTTWFAQAARWGADQELEACINYFHEYDTSWGEDSDLIAGLRAARRPKPPSLKERALKALRAIDSGTDRLGDSDIIRRALEQLP